MKKLIITAAVMFAFAACDSNRTNSNTNQPGTDSPVNNTPDTSSVTDTLNNNVTNPDPPRQ